MEPVFKRINNRCFNNSSFKTSCLKAISAYTLIELMIAIGVMTLLFGLTYANFRTYSRRQRVKASARMLEEDLRLTKKYALSGIKSAVGCAVLDGYRLKVNSSSNSYSILPVCDGGIEGILVKNVVMESDIDSLSASPTQEVTFKVVGLGTDLAGPMIITITQKTTSYQAEVVVGQSGEITSVLK